MRIASVGGPLGQLSLALHVIPLTSNLTGLTWTHGTLLVHAPLTRMPT